MYIYVCRYAKIDMHSMFVSTYTYICIQCYLHVFISNLLITLTKRRRKKMIKAPQMAQVGYNLNNLPSKN